MSISATFDQLLRGGRVICPASGIDGIRDVAIRNGKIAAVQRDILPTSAREVIDVTGKLVLPGLIDTHAHVYQYVTGRFGMNADMVGVQSGVTTLVDQGGPSCMTLPASATSSPSQRSRASMPSCRPTSSAGWKATTTRKLYSPDGVDIDATVKSATANLDIVRGIKAHAEIGGFARWGIRVIEMAAEIGRRADLPVYVHFGQLWGLPESGTNGEDVDTILERVIPSAARGRRAGASVHAPPRRLCQSRGRRASGDPGGARSRPEGRRRPRQPFLLSARQEGARRRHHSRHARRRHARLQHPRARAAGTPDEHEDDENHPFAGQAKFSLVQAMSSMMALGLTLEQVVPMVTSNPAKMLGRADEIGALKVGMEADVSVLGEERGRFVLRDNEKNEVIAERLLQPVFCLRAGTRYDAVAPILPQAVAA